MNQVRVLYILGQPMKRGGTETYIMNYYRNINHNLLQFDFVYQGEEPGIYDDELKKEGSKIFHVANKIKHPILYSKQLKNILIKEEYKIVHSQMDAMGAWPLKIAKNVKIPIRIAHSHNTQHQTNNIFKLMVNEIARRYIRCCATDYWACSRKAGYWLFGKKIYSQGKVQIINNAIDIEKYKFNKEIRKRKREELEIEKYVVIGHIGQFRKQKNHLYLINIFKQLLKNNKNYKLVLVGDGPFERKIKNVVKKNGIEKNIIFLGNQKETNLLYNCFDIFVLPSLFEGFPLVSIEAQVNGLPCYISKNISEEIKITDLVTQINIKLDTDMWVKEIINTKTVKRDIYAQIVSDKGYDIKKEAIRLQTIYINLRNKKDN